MDAYQTEEEQVASLKKWWSQNSRVIILGVGLGLFSIAGWQVWKDKTLTHTLEASDVYQQLAKSVKDSKFDAAILFADEIERTYSDTPYAALAGMQKAKVQIEQGDRKGATATLENVAVTATNNSIQHVARVRAFRIRVGDGETKAVIADIDSLIAEENGLNPGEFIGQYEAIKGDAYRLLGDVEKARYGYITALRNATLDRRIIQLKLDDLGPPPVDFGDEKTASMNAESAK
ncbi:MAG: hypothetical protein A6F72_02840 [Cycloclasticus sp. symbiont of Poecilosclerida sp. N]|nr:MAG: hypothetical protein A6F72_02840 [Cycloclasticus sp. symbiont of Poecilosclerida sp. N]